VGAGDFFERKAGGDFGAQAPGGQPVIASHRMLLVACVAASTGETVTSCSAA